MSLESPQTYGEHYWRWQVDATLQVQEANEKELQPAVSSLIDGLQLSRFLPAALQPFFATLQSPGAPAFANILARFGSEVADGIANQGLQHALQDFNYQMAEWFQDLKIDKDTASLLWVRSKITEELYTRRMKQAGFEEAEAAAYLESHIPYPQFPDVVRWARYNHDPDNFQADVLERHRFDVTDWDMWQWLTAQVPHMDQIQTLYRTGYWTLDDAAYELARQGWGENDRYTVLELAHEVPNPMLLTQAGLHYGDRNEDILEAIHRGGIKERDAQAYFDAVLSKPDASDVIRYALRRDPSLGLVGDDLRKIGIHPDWHDLYKMLAYYIPPVGDLITMAVREAFSPTIAQRFGQYEDYPKDLTTYAAMQGVSEEWAQRYWAAHWALPSPQQGFEMLHRGVIDTDDLDLLLRAQDVMPFWRDKLTAIAYNPLTRVDVRRMYGLGVLNEQEVYESYLDAGYNETNAERLAEFTVKQTLASQSGFTSTDVTKAYRERLIDRSEASALLSMIGTKQENILTILNYAEYEREWDYTTERIQAIRNLYRQKVNDENTTLGLLAGLNLPATEIETLMQQWYQQVKETVSPLWTAAQTLGFLKKGLIDEQRARTELSRHDYDQEHIDVYIASVTA